MAVKLVWRSSAVVISGLTKLSGDRQDTGSMFAQHLGIVEQRKAFHLNRQAAFFVAQNFPVGGAYAAILAIEHIGGMDGAFNQGMPCFLAEARSALFSSSLGFWMSSVSPDWVTA